MDIALKIIIVLITSSCIAILFKASKKHFIATILVGSVSFFINDILKNHIHEIASIAAAAFTMAMISQYLSKKTKSPSQGFIISGAIFLVPGIKMFSIFNNIRAENTVHAIENFYGVLAIACTISFSIVIATILVPTYRDL